MSRLKGVSTWVKTSQIVCNICSVTGGRVGLSNLLPWHLRMAVTKYSSLGISSINSLKPWILLKYWMPLRYTLMALYDNLWHTSTQKFSRTCSAKGNGVMLNRLQNAKNWLNPVRYVETEFGSRDLANSSPFFASKWDHGGPTLHLLIRLADCRREGCLLWTPQPVIETNDQRQHFLILVHMIRWG